MLTPSICLDTIVRIILFSRRGSHGSARGGVAVEGTTCMHGTKKCRNFDYFQRPVSKMPSQALDFFLLFFLFFPRLLYWKNAGREPSHPDVVTTLGIIKLLLSYFWAPWKWVAPRTCLIGRPARGYSVSPYSRASDRKAIVYQVQCYLLIPYVVLFMQIYASQCFVSQNYCIYIWEPYIAQAAIHGSAKLYSTYDTANPHWRRSFAYYLQRNSSTAVRQLLLSSSSLLFHVSSSL